MLGTESAAFSHESPLNTPCDGFSSGQGDPAGEALVRAMGGLGLAQILALTHQVSEASRCESWFCHLPVV